MAILQEYRKLLAGERYRDLSALMAEADLDALREGWKSFEPMEKLALFKLLSAPRALAFYSALPFEEKYFLLCGHGSGAIAPLTEGQPPEVRRLFIELPQDAYDRMLRDLLSKPADLRLDFGVN